MYGTSKYAGSAMRVMVLMIVLVLTPKTDAAGCLQPNSEDRPINVTVIPGDSKASMSWKFRKGVCYQDFIVSATPLNPGGAPYGTNLTFTTKYTTTEIPKLQNGVKYKFEVTAVLYDKVLSGSTVVIATPFRNCSHTEKPGPPASLSATANGTQVTLCWSAPKTGGCADEYRIARRPEPSKQITVITPVEWQYFTAETPGCMKFDGNTDRTKYEYAVQAFNSNTSSGSFATTTVDIVATWRCASVKDYYPVCTAASNGKCQAMDCQKIAVNGQCSSPSVRQIDIPTKTVLQYCSSYCGCELPSASEVQNAAMLADMKVADNFPNFCCA